MLILLLLMFGRGNAMIVMEGLCPDIKIHTKKISNSFNVAPLYLKEFYEITSEFGKSLPISCVMLTVHRYTQFSGISKMKFEMYEHRVQNVRKTTSKQILLGVQDTFKIIFYKDSNGKIETSVDCEIYEAPGLSDLYQTISDPVDTEVILSEDEREIAFYSCININTTHSLHSYMYFCNEAVIVKSAKVEESISKLIDKSSLKYFQPYFCSKLVELCQIWDVIHSLINSNKTTT